MQINSLPTNILTILLELYDQDTASKLLPEIMDLLDAVPATPPKAYPDADRDLEWYRDLRLYVTYPDAFVGSEGKADFNSLAAQLPKIKELGCNAVHVLPFLESPQVDKGFDVSDFYNVESDYGGDEAFATFLAAAQQQELAVFMDLVFNHVSIEHEWARKAQAGEEYYRKFFITSQNRPEVLARYQRDGVEYAKYLWQGQELEIAIYFPDQAGEAPHWHQGSDGYWYYHSFYPQQWDLNWNNPEVLKEMLKVLTFWAKKGLNFRLDAILAVYKRLITGFTNKTAKTYKVLELLHILLKTISPYAVLLPETLDYLDKAANTTGHDANHIRTELIYNFELSANLWYATASESCEPIWRTLAKYAQIPTWVTPVNFLRNHDELNIELISMEEKIKTTEVLLGISNLADAKAGISGRTTSFLKEDLRRVTLIYMLLFIMPGAPAIIYGDEFGKTNDQPFADEQLALKKSRNFQNAKLEYRDIGRGRVTSELINSEKGQYIFNELSYLLNKRAEFGRTQRFEKYSGELPAKVFGLVHTFDHAQILALVNLSGENIEVALPAEPFEIICNINCPIINQGRTTIPPYSGFWLKLGS